jgi:hypothetical protein
MKAILLINSIKQQSVDKKTTLLLQSAIFICQMLNLFHLVYLSVDVFILSVAAQPILILWEQIMNLWVQQQPTIKSFHGLNYFKKHQMRCFNLLNHSEGIPVISAMYL